MKSKINSSTLKSSVRGKEKFQATQGNKQDAQYKKETLRQEGKENSNVTLTPQVVKTKSYMAPGACQLQYLINCWFSHWKSEEV